MREANRHNRIGCDVYIDFGEVPFGYPDNRQRNSIDDYGLTNSMRIRMVMISPASITKDGYPGRMCRTEAHIAIIDPSSKKGAFTKGAKKVA